MKQRRTRREQPATPMFPNHDDLPLFSGTPQSVEDSPFMPEIRLASVPQILLPGFDEPNEEQQWIDAH